MPTDAIEQLRRDLSASCSATRRAALERVSGKSGRQIVLKMRGECVVPLLVQSLSDDDRTVQRAAARALRPWIASTPELLDDVLPHYAASTFDGSYSHLGLYDTDAQRILVPRFAAVKGHAALLADGNTDRYFKFEFYLQNQAPTRFAGRDEDRHKAHLVLHFILDWSYAHQNIVPDIDERRVRVNEREQQGYARAIQRFYRGCKLPYDVAVHHLTMRAAKRPRYRFNVGLIAKTVETSKGGKH